jgi:FHA domain-containing protein
MSIKTWMLSGMNRVFARTDLPPREVPSRQIDEARVEPILRASGARAGPGGPEHLGRYAPLIGAIRQQLEEFVESELRLHLAIAERDRYLLTSIRVESIGSEEARQLLERFTREFTPEQVRQFLAKEVIARLPNANAIDLAQFSGIETAGDPEEDDGGAYRELLDELHREEPERDVRRYNVALVGRWSQTDAQSVAQATRRHDGPTTPLASRDIAIDIEDGDGARRIQFSALPGRRYVIGKDDGCDIVVKGMYASRRHCEIWLDHGSFWITDCGSTNGVRVEAPPTSATSAEISVNGDGAILEVRPGARIVLSAAGEGSAKDYPRLSLVHAPTAASFSAATLGSTPVTPIVPSREANALSMRVETAAGVRLVDVPWGSKPMSVGRSRSQDVVIEREHQGVSGHHLDIVDCDADGASVVVHGDNGVALDGTLHRAGTRLRWGLNQPMTLARPSAGDPPCTLMLSARASPS